MTRARSILLWAGSAIVWLIAPLAGLLAFNIPVFLIWAGRGSGDARPVSGAFVLAGVAIALWAAAAFLLGRLHESRGRRLHRTACLALFAFGVTLPLLATLPMLLLQISSSG